MSAHSDVLSKINKLKSWQVAVGIFVLGFITYFPGLKNPFEGDDTQQIVSNIPVHSISHIVEFFKAGTVYVGGNSSHLSGIYYRPLMTTTFSLLYTLFGPRPFYFHALQLFIVCSSAFLLYLFFKYSFNTLIPLSLALLFLVHPINSQTVYMIATMQDALFFFFGILAMWLLLRFKSTRSLFAVMACLFLSLLSKETGALFVIMAIVYLFWWERRRLYKFLEILAIPIALYLVLKIHATGLNNHPTNGPIDSADLSARLFTMPSIFLFYVLKFILPFKLATIYQWLNPKFSVTHVLIPLIVDLAIIAAFIFIGKKLKLKAKKKDLYTYYFFLLWAALGMLAHLQIIALDATAVETWFYFSAAGIFGMIGVLLTAYKKKINTNWLMVATAILIVLFGARSFMRGFDYQSSYVLASRDIVASPDDYYADEVITQHDISAGNFVVAQNYEEHAIKVFPQTSEYIDLGTTQTSLSEYYQAINTYEIILKSPGYEVTSSQLSLTYTQIAELMLVYPNQRIATNFLNFLVNTFPNNCNFWQDHAMYDQEHGNNTLAITLIQKAAQLCQVSPGILQPIMENKSFMLELGQTQRIITI